MKLKSIAGFISPKFKEPSVCGSCGNEFVCGASFKGCWCMNIELTDEDRTRLKSEFTGCLCRKCLENHSTNK